MSPEKVKNAIEYVDHPKHYNSHPSGVEAIDICECMGFSLGNAFKYAFRADKKWDTLEDLRKALWYLNREANRRKTLYKRLTWLRRPVNAELDLDMRRVAYTEMRFAPHLRTAFKRMYEAHVRYRDYRPVAAAAAEIQKIINSHN